MPEVLKENPVGRCLQIFISACGKIACMFKFKSDHSFIIDTVHFGDCYTDFYIAVMGRIRFRRFLVVKIIVIYYRQINDLRRGSAIFSNRFYDFFSCGYFACQSKNSEVGNIMPVIGSRRNTDAVHNAIGFREGLGRGVKYHRVDDFSLFVFTVVPQYSSLAVGGIIATPARLL